MPPPASRIEVEGRRRGASVLIAWEDGALEGWPAAILAARIAAAAGPEVGFPGMVNGPATLERDAHPELIAATMAEALDEVTAVRGLASSPPLPALTSRP